MSESSERSLRDIWESRPSMSGTSEAIYETIREAILDNVLSPGEKLSEEKLAEELGVSRTPIREALLRLEAQRLTVRPSRRGVVVSSLTENEILEIYTVRAQLDGLAARLATANIIPPKLAELRWINSQMKESAEAEDYATMARLNIELHHAQAEASGNAFLDYLMSQVHDRVRRFPGTTFSYEDRALEAVEEHTRIIDAIERGDGEDAEALARAHMDRAREIRIKMVVDGEDQGSADSEVD